MAESKTTEPTQQNTAPGSSKPTTAVSSQTNRAAVPSRRMPAELSGPFAFFDRMAEEMDRTFDRIFRDFGLPRRDWLAHTPGGRTSSAPWTPRIEAFQKGDRYVVRAELPGLNKEDVQVEMTSDMLTIQGERHAEHEEEKDNYYHSEREYGRFYRTIPLPEGVIGESAEATFRNGVLEVTMQAAPEEANRGRRLDIKEDSGTQGGERS
jgi:HSP20 family protein